jgi:hypothetical protein
VVRLRNVLIALGAFWLSLCVGPWLDIIFGSLKSKMTYDSVWFEAIAMGTMLSMGRALAAVLGAGMTRFAVISRSPERWALIVAGLYLVDAPLRYFQSYSSMTSWDHLWWVAAILWPTIACLISIAVMAYLRKKDARNQTSLPAT